MHDTSPTSDHAMSPRILILGSGQDGGSPQFGYSTGTGSDRTASSVAVVSPLGSVVLLDASPDLRLQSHTLVNWHGYPPDRNQTVDAVAITHGHMGHYAGLVHFGREAANSKGVRLVATASFLDFTGSNAPWDALVANGNVIPTVLDTNVSIDESLDIVGIPVPHRAEYTDTVGLSVVIGGEPVLLYLPDIDGWDQWPDAHGTIAEHRVSIIDATFTSPEELGHRDYASILHPLVTDSIGRFGDLTDSHTIILSHINHTNPLADPTSRIAQAAQAAGFVVAHDTMDVLL